MISPVKRKQAVEKVIDRLHVSPRRACRVSGQPRSSQRHQSVIRDDEDALTGRIIEFASRFGYRRITALLRMEG